jgi:xanthine dehydrogenase accessory factor
VKPHGPGAPLPEDPREGGALERSLGADRPGPTREQDVWDGLARWRAERRRFVLATVVDAKGFTPRKSGAHMLIAAGGATVGTVGGGAIEQVVLEEAARLLVGGGTFKLRRHLTQELGMCCGGEMELFLEVLEPAPRLFVFGAGYIAKPLAAIAAGCGFEVTVVDGRPDWATPERFPTSSLRVEEPEGALARLESAADDFAVVVTHDHALDQRLVQGLLRRPLRFVGMIGSVPKQRKFALRLKARGFADADIARLRTPLGLPIGAASPEEIAVSVMAELIAVRRGQPVQAGWTPPERSGGAAAGEEPEAAPQRASSTREGESR